MVVGQLTWQGFIDLLIGATRTSCMIAFILAGAAYLTAAMGFTGIPRALAEWITEFKMPPWALLTVLTAFYIVLGCFLDGISMVVLTTSIIIPLVMKAGFDLIWFGIYIVLVVEMAQITPPVGFNLYVLQGMTGRNIFTIGAYALPLFVFMCVAVGARRCFSRIGALAAVHDAGRALASRYTHALSGEYRGHDRGCVKQCRYIEALPVHGYRQGDDHKRLQKHQLAHSRDAAHRHRRIEYEKRKELTDQTDVSQSGPGRSWHIREVSWPKHEGCNQ